jgi:REP-associated tyrosine transposase
MPHIIRRVRRAGVYFVTSRTWNGRPLFARPEVAQILLDQLLDCRQRGFYKLHPFVIMPDHFHVLLTPSDTTSLEKAVQMIKGGSSHRIKQHLTYASPVWQEGFHDRWIRDESEFQERAAYIRSNPVTAKLATVPEEYVFASASGHYLLDSSKYEKSTSGAEAPSSIHNDYVAVKTATYKDSAAKANPHHKS